MARKGGGQSAAAAAVPATSTAVAAARRGRPLRFSCHSVASEAHAEHNEDRAVVDRGGGLAAVFDGVGGSAAGEAAAQIAALGARRGGRRALRRLQPAGSAAPVAPLGSVDDLCAALCGLVADLHEQIRGGATPAGMQVAETRSTTAALAAFARRARSPGYTLVYAWVGDSRIYLLHGAESLARLTEDDGLLTTLVHGQRLSADHAARIDQATDPAACSDMELILFNRRNGITQALGDVRPPSVHVARANVTPGDRVLLCTDGVHDNLTDHEIEAIMRGHGARGGVARALVEAALLRSRGVDGAAMRAKPDDMTAVVVTCARA